MECNAILKLKPQVKILERGGKVGADNQGNIIWAKDELQTMLLREIAENPKSVQEMYAVLHTARETESMLILADFILTFEQCIDN